MSFKWKCGCGKDIIVPYADSPQKMSSYAICVCEECYDRLLKEERSYYDTEEEFKHWTEEHTSENGLPYFITVDGGIYACKTK